MYLAVRHPAANIFPDILQENPACGMDAGASGVQGCVPWGELCGQREMASGDAMQCSALRASCPVLLHALLAMLSLRQRPCRWVMLVACEMLKE